jgi:hypothetical protein
LSVVGCFVNEQVSYQGDCSCLQISGKTVSPGNCRLIDRPGADSCVAVWTAAMPAKGGCSALAVLNIGDKVARVTVEVPAAGGAAVADRTARLVYEGTVEPIVDGKVTAAVPAHGAALYLFTPEGATTCV